jgi:hypothetical protein
MISAHNSCLPGHSTFLTVLGCRISHQCDATTNISVFYEWEDPRLIDLPENQPLPDNLWQPEFHVYAYPAKLFSWATLRVALGVCTVRTALWSRVIARLPGAGTARRPTWTMGTVAQQALSV